MSGLAAESQARHRRVHVLVQTERAVTPQDRERLKAGGVTLYDALTPSAFHAMVELDGALGRASGDRLGLSGWGVSGIEGFDPQAKLAETLRGGAAPSWAQAEVSGQPAADVIVSYYPDTDAREAIAALKKLGAASANATEYFERIGAKIPLDQLMNVAKLDWVRAVEPIAPPPAPTNNNATSSSMLKVSDIQDGTPNLTGDGVKISIIDGGRVGEHPDLAGRVTWADSGNTSTHATHVAGTVAASGVSDARIKGIAPNSHLISYTFFGDIALKMLMAKNDHGAVLSTNSWGNVVSEELENCNSFGSYGATERDLDRLARVEKLNIVFAIGNDRSMTGCSVRPRGGLYTTGRPAAAKNILSVGAVDVNSAMSEFSNFGPATDGRVKPELTALGVSVRSTAPGGGTFVLSGTSMSTPAVTGLVALMIEDYRRIHGGENPDPALVKAILTNTATDLGNPGPDYVFGYGIPNAAEAIAAIENQRQASGTLAEGQQRFSIDVPAGASALRVALAYSDMEGAGTTEKNLINDLDLKLIGPDGQEVLPLTLDPANPNADAQPGVNGRDPLEQAVVRDPAVGAWTVEVSVRAAPGGEQPFWLAWSFADMAVPACTTTVVPTLLQLGAAEGTEGIAVTRANQCEAWSTEAEDSWLGVRYASSSQGSGVVKVFYGANDTGGVRMTGLRAAGARVAVTQNSPCAVHSIPEGEWVNSFLESSDCLTRENSYSKQYSFEGQAGQFVSIELTSPSFDTFLELRSEDGNLIALDDDGGSGTDSRIPPDQGGLYLPFSGKYVIVATSYNARVLGRFSLLWQTVTPDASQTRGMPKTIDGCPVEVGGTISGETSSTSGRRGSLFPTDVYLIPGRIGQQLTAEIIAAAFDTVMYLVSPNGELTDFNDDASGTTNSRIERTLTEAGYWRLEVAGYLQSARGDYSLALHGCNALPQ